MHAYIQSVTDHTNKHGSYIHTCIQAYVHTHMHVYIHTYIHTYMHKSGSKSVPTDILGLQLGRIEAQARAAERLIQKETDFGDRVRLEGPPTGRYARVWLLCFDIRGMCFLCVGGELGGLSH